MLIMLTVSLGAVEFTSPEGAMRLVIHEKTGRFSLYADGEALIADANPRTSLLSLLVDGRAVALGGKVTVTEGEGGPALMFETPKVLVFEEFSLFSYELTTGPAGMVAGLRITVDLVNRTAAPVTVGARYLLDTVLGEAAGRAHFETDQRPLAAETILGWEHTDSWWASRSGRHSLVGLLTDDRPDALMFANWQRLYEAPWKSSYLEGRSFSRPPDSLNDSAVCYYYEPVSLAPWGVRTFTITLALGDERPFRYFNATPLPRPFVDLLDEADRAAYEEVLNIDGAFTGGASSTRSGGSSGGSSPANPSADPGAPPADPGGVPVLTIDPAPGDGGRQ